MDTGAGGDLKQATEYALSMVTSYGMNESFGLAAVDRGTAMRSPEIMNRVNEILAEEMNNTVRLISGNRDKIYILVKALLDKNRLTGEEIKRLI